MRDADFDLLRAHLDGDAAAFATLAGRHGPWIARAARRRLHDDHLADDARQAVLLLLAEKADTLVRSEVPSVAAWLFRATHFTCANLRRTRSRQARYEAVAGESGLAGLPSADAERPDDARLAMLEDTIADLPPRDREAIVRRFYQRESFARIGGSLGISEEAARKRVARLLARCRAAMAVEGVDTEPERLLDRPAPPGDTAPDPVPDTAPNTARPSGRATAGHGDAIADLARETLNTEQQMESIRFAVMTAEFHVRSVEDHLDFFEKLGFRRHFAEAASADGAIPKASLRGGHARIWLRRATPECPPAPGVTVYVWLDGGEPAVIRHRDSVIAAGVVADQFYYDGALMNYTVTSPDGYTVGFFSTFQPHTFDAQADG